MEIEISETSMENWLDDEFIPCSADSNIIMQRSTTLEINHTSIDMLGRADEVIPCSAETSTAENGGGVILLEMINNGLQKVSTDQDSARRQSWTIYKVEQNLKKAHEDSTFHPKLVSIGPFLHNKSDHLKPMEQHKWRFLSIFLENCVSSAHFLDNRPSRSSTSSATSIDNDADIIIKTQKIQCLIAAMEKVEARTRACYSETFDDLDSKEFVLMMLLDGCFIIELLLLFQRSVRSCRNADDPIYTWRSTLPYLRHDMLLLENQLPFTVLQEILVISGTKDWGRNKFTYLVLEFFNPVLFREKMVLDACKKHISNSKDYCHYNHLLDLFMSSFQTRKPVHQLFPEKNTFQEVDQQVDDQDPSEAVYCGYFPEHIPNDGRDQDMSIHCVTELREAGIEFKKRDDHHHDLLDIEFKNGKLHIPCLFIDANTVPVLLNFIAYEQRHRSVKPYFTSYVMFLNYLVNSSKDVEHLHYKGIINHGLGSDEDVATLFNTLCKEVVLELGDDNYLSKVFTDVNKYFGKQTNRWRATWKHEYFRNPWAFTSFLAAIVLIVLTFLQTYFSMYAYFYPPPNCGGDFFCAIVMF